MWEPIGPHCLVTKITNDSVYFILLACLALPFDTHWLFQCELASCVAAQFGHTDLCIYFGIFWARYQDPGHTRAFEHGSEGLTHFGEFSLFLQLQEKRFVYHEWQLLTRIYSHQVILHWVLGFNIEDLCLIPLSRLDFDTQHERPITKVREQCDFMVDMNNTEGQWTEYKIVWVLDLDCCPKRPIPQESLGMYLFYCYKVITHTHCHIINTNIYTSIWKL